jgi:hypothetical protein
MWTVLRYGAWRSEWDSEKQISLFEGFLIDRIEVGLPYRSLRSEIWDEYYRDANTSNVDSARRLSSRPDYLREGSLQSSS